jgi:hypothetical protein
MRRNAYATWPVFNCSVVAAFECSLHVPIEMLRRGIRRIPHRSAARDKMTTETNRRAERQTLTSTGARLLRSAVARRGP